MVRVVGNINPFNLLAQFSIDVDSDRIRILRFANDGSEIGFPGSFFDTIHRSFTGALELTTFYHMKLTYP